MIEVTVEFVGWINRYTQLENSKTMLSLSASSKIRGILELLAVPVDLPQIILLNGKPADLETFLTDGDKVQFLPLVCGG